ncbi:MAG: sigma 54-interacting transcriptional regulator [Polyangiaceae bacterium]
MAAAPHLYAPPALAAASAFSRLDERLASGVSGLVVVQCDAHVAAAIQGHAARRLKAHAHSVYVTPASTTLPAARALADLLEVDLPGNITVTQAAAALSRALLNRRGAAVLPLPAPGSWDESVFRELSHTTTSTVVLVGAGWFEGAKAERFELDRTFAATDRAVWAEALACDLPNAEDLADLERWWAAARARGSEALARSEASEVAPAAASLVSALRLLERPWRISDLTQEQAEALPLATREGLVESDHGYVQLTSRGQSFEVAPVSADAAVTAAVALERLQDDPWALSTAAIRLLEASHFDRAGDAQARAFDRVSDPAARRQIFDRWFAALEGVPVEARHTLRSRTAERALEAGDFGDASRVTKKLVSDLRAPDALSLLLHARAAIGTGDLTAGRVSLEQARKVAAASELPEILAESAELAYLEGRAEEARTMANEAHTLSESPSVKLRARNTLGKVLLREARWEDADAHFSEDVLFAAAASDLTAELRARCNRGMALISMGRMNEAERVLIEVRTEAEQSSHPTATLYALSNLAVIALRTNRYGLALELQSQLIPLQHALRNNRALLHDFLNIAQLRVKFGMYTQAEHALTFARRGIKTCPLPHLQAYLFQVEADLALGRGDTVAARKFVAQAIAAATENAYKKDLTNAWVLSARIALEDGDVRKASLDLERAEQHRSDDRGSADLLLVKALVARAAGASNMLELAHDAVAAAGETGDDDRLVESHSLLAHIYRARGEGALASAHAQRASAHRDCVIEGLGSEQGLAYSAKASVVALGKLSSSLDAEVPPSAPVRMPSLPPASASSAHLAPRDRELIGNDSTILSLRAAIRKIGRTDTTVLIRGESGTGKELVAEALHRASERANGPLVSVNCAALVETLLLGELFGHEKGAFTGASARKRGRFELAEGGTLFLDEIGDISPKTQVALLRVLQEKTFERVGGTTQVRANVRIICATHRDLRAMVERGEFREDLYYRLRGVTLEVPALRARISDLPLIAQNLLERIAQERNEASAKTLSADAIELLSRHRWPGNVRELENVLRSVTVFCDDVTVSAADLLANTDEFSAIAQGAPSSRAVLSTTDFENAEVDGAPVSMVSLSEEDSVLPAGEARATEVAYGQIRQGTVSLFDMKRQIERDCIARALSETKGNITKAAALLGMKRPRLSQLVKQYGLAAVEGLS